MRVVADALAMADVAADTIGYVEGYGTGTLGDAIEVEALRRVFRAEIRLGRLRWPGLGEVEYRPSRRRGRDRRPDQAGAVVPPPQPAALDPCRAAEPRSRDRHVAVPRGRLADGLGRRDAPRRSQLLRHGGRQCAPRARGSAARAGSCRGPARPSPGPVGPHARRPWRGCAAGWRTISEAAPEDRLADVAATLQSGRKPFARRWAAACDGRDAALSRPRSMDSASAAAGPEAPGVVFMFPG